MGPYTDDMGREVTLEEATSPHRPSGRRYYDGMKNEVFPIYPASKDEKGGE